VEIAYTKQRTMESEMDHSLGFVLTDTP